MEEPIGSTPGSVHIVADTNYETNHKVYASTTGIMPGIYRNAPPFFNKEVSWLNVPGQGLMLSPGQSITGMVTYGGVLYAIWCDGSNSALERCLNPSISVPPKPEYAEEVTPPPGEDSLFNATTPRALKISEGPKLWAIDTGRDRVLSLSDVIATVGPTLAAPAADTSIQVNPTTGKAYDVTFTIQRQMDKVDAIELQIATDEDFAGLVYSQAFALTKDVQAETIGPTGVTTITTETVEVVTTTENYTYTSTNATGNVTTIEIPVVTSTEEVSVDVETNRVCNFMPDATYYWRTRTSVDGPFYSPWSEVRSFGIGSAPPPIVVEPAPPPAPAPVVKPEVKVEIPPSPDITLTSPEVKVVVPEAAPAVAPIPQWALILIIAIGAVLLISVIVLIVRTRRVA
jgi:hypothetical protein